MRKRFLVVLALALVFSLVFSSVAMAAPEGKEISNKLELEVTVKEGATIEVNPDLALTSAVGLYDCFTVSTTPGDYENEMVRGKLKVLEGWSDGFELEYVEQDSEHGDYKKYLPLPVDENGEAWFGPSTGFPLAAVTGSMFRVTWRNAGEYTFKVSIMGGDNFDTELASDTVKVNVIDGDPMALTHATAGAGEVASIKDSESLMSAIAALNPTDEPAQYTVTKEGKFDYVVVSNLANGVSHVDNTLFVFEVTKDGGEITTNDFEITEISLRNNTEGINDTFEIVDGKLKGYWGPAGGFLFADKAATAFTVKFNAEGTYTVNTYAIQVAPAAQADL